MTPQKGRSKVVRRGGKGKPTLATGNKTTPPADWVAFLAGITRGKTVLEYGANRTIYRQGDPADCIFYIRRGRVKRTVTSQLRKGSDRRYFG